MNQVTVSELKQWINEGKDFVLIDITYSQHERNTFRQKCSAVL